MTEERPDGTRDLECWSCGADLKDVLRPIRSTTQCPACRADLHVCRMCRFYDPKVLGECTHDRADRVLIKENANYCAHYRPRSQSYAPKEKTEALAAQASLRALFGDPSVEEAGPSAVSAVDQAKAQWNA